jgi:DNA repair protein RadC
VSKTQRAGTTNQFATLKLDIIKESVDVVGSQNLADLCREWGLTNSAQEAFWVVAYDAMRNVRTVTEVAKGGWDEVTVSIPAVMSAVLMSGTDRFMVVHNHPPGDVTPTTHDVALTEHIQMASQVLGLHFEDHIIVAPPKKWLSMVKSGLITPSRYIANPKAATGPSWNVTYFMKGDSNA